MAAIKAVCIDLSGTVHIGPALIDGAAEAIKRLRAASIGVRFVTNSSKEAASSLLGNLRGMGVEVADTEVFTALSAAKQLVTRRSLRPLLLLSDSAKEDFKDCKQDDPNAVVVGLAPEVLDYAHMTTAFRLLKAGAPLIAVNKSRYLMGADGQLTLGPGAFVAGLEFAADCKADVVGKPSPLFFHQALSSLDCEAKEAVMIGDDARDDVAAAQAVGMRGILVKTGKYTPGMEDLCNADIVLPSIVEAVEWILQTNERVRL